MQAQPRRQGIEDLNNRSVQGFNSQGHPTTENQFGFTSTRKQRSCYRRSQKLATSLTSWKVQPSLLTILMLAIMMLSARGQDYCYDVPWTNVTDTSTEFPPPCTCAQYYVWDDVNSGCRVNCANVPRGGNEVLYDTCSCDPGFIWVVSNYIEVTCDLADCTKIAFTDATSLADNQCTCIDGFVWNAETRACEINCAQISDAGDQVDAATCECDTDFHWNPDTYKCDADPPTRDCTNDTHSTYLIISDMECQCKANYVWSFDTMRCELNCSNVLHSSSTEPSVNGICPCLPKYFFDQYMPQCVINCSLINNSLNANVENDPENCRCRTKYIWNVESLECQLSCVNVAASTQVNDTAFSCVCNTGYYWLDLTGECRLHCGSMDFGLLVLASPNACRCRTGATWSISSRKCLLQCGSIANANSTASPPALTATLCVCKDTFAWNTTMLMCLPTPP